MTGFLAVRLDISMLTVLGFYVWPRPTDLRGAAGH